MQPTLVDHAWVLLWAVILPLYGSHVAYPRQLALLRAGTPGHRATMMARNVRRQWTLAVLLLVGWIAAGRPLEGLGLAAPRWIPFVVLVLAIAVLAWILHRQVAMVRVDAELRARVRAEIDRVAPFAPRERADAPWFFAAAVTAGVCEELLMRGYLLAYLGAYVATVPAIAISSVVFGLAHTYQGPRGVLKTGVIGLGLAVLYWATGALWVPMLLHALIDVNAGRLSLAAWSQPDDVRA